MDDPLNKKSPLPPLSSSLILYFSLLSFCCLLLHPSLCLLSLHPSLCFYLLSSLSASIFLSSYFCFPSSLFLSLSAPIFILSSHIYLLSVSLYSPISLSFIFPLPSPTFSSSFCLSLLFLPLSSIYSYNFHQDFLVPPSSLF